MPTVRRRATRGAVARLVVLLVMVSAMIALERVVGHMRVHYYLAGRHETTAGAAALAAVHMVRYVVAGLLIDAYGPKRMIALALIAWCVLAMATAFTTDPLGLATIDLAQGFAFAPFYVGALVAARRLLPSGRFGLPIAIADRSMSVWVLAVPFIIGTVVGTSPGGGAAFDRQWQAMALASVGALLTLVWLVGFREVPGDDSPTLDTIAQEAVGLMRKRLFLVLVVMEACAEFAGHIASTRPMHFLDHARQVSAATVGAAVFLPEWIDPVACLIAAAVSDRMVRRRVSLDRARRPFIIGGFLLTATIGLLPILHSRDLVTMVCVAAAGYGLLFVSTIVFLDVAPPRYAGTIVGTMLALDAIVKFVADEISIVVYQPARSYVPILVIAAIVALAGAFVAYRWLRDLAPLAEPRSRVALPELF